MEKVTTELGAVDRKGHHEQKAWKAGMKNHQ